MSSLPQIDRCVDPKKVQQTFFPFTYTVRTGIQEEIKQTVKCVAQFLITTYPTAKSVIGPSKGLLDVTAEHESHLFFEKAT